MDDNNTTPTTKGLGTVKGASGTIIQGGIIQTEEYNRDLIGRYGLQQYEIMRRSDATIRMILQLCKLPLLGLTWDILPASEEPSDVYQAELIKRELMGGRNVNWQSFLAEALTELEFGYSVFEKTLEITDFDGKVAVGIKNLGFRKQNSIYAWETQDHKPGVTQQLVGEIVSIPATKIVVFTNQKEGDNYEGVSMLRYAYKDWYMKDVVTKINGIALEKLGIGVPHITFGSDVSPAEKARARDILRQFRGNEEGYLETPEGSTIEMLDLKSNTVKDALPTIKHHDQQIALSVMGQFMLLGSTETGSRATSQDHSKLFLLSEEALANQIQSVIQEQIIKQLVDLNTSNIPNGYPTLIHNKIEDEDVTVFSSAVQSLGAAGALTFNFETEQAIRQVVHLPELTEDYKADYEEKRKASKEMVTNPPEATSNLDKAEEKPKPGKDIKATAVLEARQARQKLIDVLVS